MSDTLGSIFIYVPVCVSLYGNKEVGPAQRSPLGVFLCMLCTFLRQGLTDPEAHQLARLLSAPGPLLPQCWDFIRILAAEPWDLLDAAVLATFLST